LAMQRGTAEQSALIKAAIEAGDTTQLAEIVAIVKQTGALDATRAAAAAEAQRAIDALPALARNQHAEGLLQLAAQLTERRA
ncbi:MAG TPA: octaprenyl diphosphate synthase, partial [Variovorax sp.]|nr:octaprenyl diphosphate synthase [Variovorax sp.]